jgi:hypothetical protein
MRAKNKPSVATIKRDITTLIKEGFDKATKKMAGKKAKKR